MFCYDVSSTTYPVVSSFSAGNTDKMLCECFRRKTTYDFHRFQVPAVDFLEQLAIYGEQFINRNLYSIAFDDIYERFGSLAYQFIRARDYNEFVGAGTTGTTSSAGGTEQHSGLCGPGLSAEAVALRDPLRVARTVVRFLLGRIFCLYRLCTVRDCFCLRRDTVEDIRAGLLDLQDVVSFILNCPDLVVPKPVPEDAEGDAEAGAQTTNVVAVPQHPPHNVALQIQEQLYTHVYNVIVLGLRIGKFLRRSGHAFVVVPVLGWLSTVAEASILPLQNVQFLPMRVRLNLELISCLEAAQGSDYTKSAMKAVGTALEQVQKQIDLENLVSPVPRETSDLMEVCKKRLELLRVKYEFWVANGEEGIQVVATRVLGSQNMPVLETGKDATANPLQNVSYFLAAVLESMQLQGPSEFSRMFFEEFQSVEGEGLKLTGR